MQTMGNHGLSLMPLKEEQLQDSEVAEKHHRGKERENFKKKGIQQ